MSKRREQISCKEAREQFAMLLYGELSFDQEERVESHLDACAECRTSLEREKAVHAALDTIEVEPSPSLLRQCREDLRVRLMEEEALPVSSRGWWEQFTGWFAGRPAGRVLRPVGALALVTLGFVAARVVPLLNLETLRGGYGTMGLAEPMSRVREVEPASEGRVRIMLDETRQKVVSGRLDDAQIRALLLGAAKDPSDPGLRAETVDILNTRAQSPEVRDVLIYALRHDQNAGVRLKAMEGLKPFGHDPGVRSAFTQVLLGDANPGLRTQAIDLLTGGAAGGVDREIIGTLQELMERGEPQDYVRDRCLRVLQSMKASAELY